MDSERSLFMIVAILLVIIAIRKAQRFRFIALNMYFLRKRRQHDLISALLTRGISTGKIIKFPCMYYLWFFGGFAVVFDKIPCVEKVLFFHTWFLHKSTDGF